jgi:hypothetical protein
MKKDNFVFYQEPLSDHASMMPSPDCIACEKNCCLINKSKQKPSDDFADLLEEIVTRGPTRS